LVIDADPRLAEHLDRLAGQRMVFVVGLPGTGKSLLIHQLVHVAGRAGRRVHLLQWDVARPVFETSGAGQTFPQADGVTHPVIRRAAGLWVRAALAEWDERNRAPAHLLVGEAPFVGGRFVELARRLEDHAEDLLTAETCRFVIAAPSREVRRFIETERERRAARPLHPREREDAPPHVLRALWRDLAGIARELGLTEPSAARLDEIDPSAPAGAEPVPYDPTAYARVYTRVLRHRRAEVLTHDVILPTRALSVYDFAVRPHDVVPTGEEADAFIREVERRYAAASTALDTEADRWWQT
jgi:hypothetical protein